MKILYFSDEYPPAKSGGIGSATKIVAENLIQKENNVFVVGNREYTSSLPEFSIINGVNIYRIKCFKYLKYTPKFALRYIDALLRHTGLMSYFSKKNIRKTEDFIQSLITKEQIDILELVDYTFLIKNLKSQYHFRRFSCPTIVRAHGCKSFIEHHRNAYNEISIANDKSNFARADYICPVSKYSANFIINKLNIDSSKIHVIYNPIESNFISFKKTPINQRHNILFIGKIIETKGAFSTIKAFNKIADLHQEIKLIMIGSGEIDKACSLIDTKHRDRIIFKGYLNREEILYEIDQCLFAVVPSYFENFSMVALEIMARQRALIYTKRASGPEVINNNIDGILVDPIDIDDIAEKMNELILNFDLREKIEKNAFRKIKENFSDVKIISELENYYQQIITK